jgi:hypothetical protein
MSTPIAIEGYLTEAKLACALKAIFSKQWIGTQFSSGATRHRWDIAFREGDRLTVVEYDGDEHYGHSMKIKADRTKDDIASAAGFRVVRFPYWVQLDRLILEHWFNATVEIQQSFPHAFITTKIFPASFCELGIARFVSELNALPMTIRANSAHWAYSLKPRDRATTGLGAYKVGKH